MSGKINYNKVVQVGILTNDIKKSREKWAAFMNVDLPEIIVSADYELTQAEYRGAPCKAKIYQTFFNTVNGVQIELIQPVDETPSIWFECLKENGEGLHHLAYEVKDMAKVIEECEAKGMPLLQKGEYPGGRYAYLDDRQGTGMIVEFLEND